MKGREEYLTGRKVRASEEREENNTIKNGHIIKISLLFLDLAYWSRLSLVKVFLWAFPTFGETLRENQQEEALLEGAPMKT